jgi:pimeloyl-ACP methyl ester carboxylesterase
MNNHSKIRKGSLVVGRFEIPYRIYGNEGPLIVCLNGVQQSMAMWHSFISRFSRTFRIVVFDFPNQGKGKIISGICTVALDEQVEIVKEVAKEANSTGRIILCAASWGGVVALLYTMRYQAGVHTLILASMGTKPNARMVETIKKGMALSPESRQEMSETLIQSFGQNLPETVKEKIVTQFRTMSRENLESFYEHGLFVLSTKQLTDVVNLKSIRTKTILISGETDSIIDQDDVRYLASQLPNAELKVIKNVGHYLHLEDKTVLDIYEDILTQVIA